MFCFLFLIPEALWFYKVLSKSHAWTHIIWLKHKVLRLLVLISIQHVWFCQDVKDDCITTALIESVIISYKSRRLRPRPPFKLQLQRISLYIENVSVTKKKKCHQIWFNVWPALDRQLSLTSSPCAASHSGWPVIRSPECRGLNGSPVPTIISGPRSVPMRMAAALEVHLSSLYIKEKNPPIKQNSLTWIISYDLGQFNQYFLTLTAPCKSQHPENEYDNLWCH